MYKFTFLSGHNIAIETIADNWRDAVAMINNIVHVNVRDWQWEKQKN